MNPQNLHSGAAGPAPGSFPTVTPLYTHSTDGDVSPREGSSSRAEWPVKEEATCSPQPVRAPPTVMLWLSMVKMAVCTHTRRVVLGRAVCAYMHTVPCVCVYTRAVVSVVLWCTHCGGLCVSLCCGQEGSRCECIPRVSGAVAWSQRLRHYSHLTSELSSL